VLVELFTSEGCSSCPPADQLLEVLDATQPVSVADIIVLSEHVDYWNYIGWTDPFSSPAYTRRQQRYGRRFGLDGVYTPQMVVDGGWQLVGNDAKSALTAIRSAAGEPKIPLAFRVSQGELQITSTQPFPADVAISVVAAKQLATSQVARGENRNRELRHVAVATRVVEAGKVGRGKNAELRVPMPVESSDALRLLAYAQELRSDRIRAVCRLESA